MQTEDGEEVTRGHWWYVRYPLENELVLVYVEEVTAKTVLVAPRGINKQSARYVHDYLKFIERVT